MKSAQLGNFILVGDVGCGKSTLLKALLEHSDEVTKTQALAFHDNNIIDSPGEFISRRVLYGALLNSLIGVDTIVYLQAADNERATAPGDLLRLYPNKQLVGVISKTDIEHADVGRAEELLVEAGIPGPYFRVSIKNPDIDSTSQLAHQNDQDVI